MPHADIDTYRKFIFCVEIADICTNISCINITFDAGILFYLFIFTFDVLCPLNGTLFELLINSCAYFLVYLILPYNGLEMERYYREALIYHEAGFYRLLNAIICCTLAVVKWNVCNSIDLTHIHLFDAILCVCVIENFRSDFFELPKWILTKCNGTLRTVKC